MLYLVLREGSRSGDCSLDSRLQKRKKWQKPNENRVQEMQCLYVQKVKGIVCAVYYIIKKGIQCCGNRNKHFCQRNCDAHSVSFH